MDRAREFRFVANKVYTIPGKGVVVTGRVEKGAVSVGDEIGFIGADGQMTRATVTAIEVSRRLVEEAQAGQEASILLEGTRKNQITAGAVLMEVPEAPPSPVTPAPAQPVRYTTAEPPPSSSAKPISPSSGSGRFVFYILIGLFIIFLLLIVQGKVDKQGLDPRRWDPKKRLTSIPPSPGSFQQSALSFQPTITQPTAL